MKNFYKIFFLTIISCALVSCGAQPIKDTFNEETLTLASEAIINDFNNKDYDAITSKGSDYINKPETTETLKKLWDKLSKKLGEFKSITKVQFQDAKGEALVIASTEYENGKVKFKICFNEELQLTGIYIV